MKLPVLPLYLRIWLAVVLVIVVLTTTLGWLWSRNAEPSTVRQVVVRDEQGEVLGEANAPPVRILGRGIEFQVAMADGSHLYVHIPPRPRRPGEPLSPRPFFSNSSWLFWLFGIAALAVAIGTYPIARRLTQRLEGLQRGVQRWGEGDLSARVDESGRDEVAYLARNFNAAAQRVESLVRVHKSLLANASHELRSPLTRIRMGLELMGGSAGQPVKAALQDEISRSIAELDQLIDEILLASRLDAQESDIGSFEVIDLTGLVAEECAHSGAELEPGDTAVLVAGVAKLLRRAVRNLLENARRYGHGEVKVHVTQVDGMAELRVDDGGPGVPLTERDRIFEPFYRLPGASEREGGVGLGLALVKSIAERHAGSVHCEASPQGGARFLLKLPCEDDTGVK